MSWRSETSSDLDYSDGAHHQQYYKDRTLCDRSHIMEISLTPKHEHMVPDPEPTPAGPSRLVTRLLIALRVVSTIVSIALLGCVAGMEIYMLSNQHGIIIIPLFICRVILMAALTILVLCDWSLLPRVLKYFPMYNEQRSWKGFGFSQIVVAFFVMGDSTLAGMQDSRDKNTFARILFPLVITFGSLMIVVGAVYFVAGVMGGAGLKAGRTPGSASKTSAVDV
ncbi:hypothetical protein GQ54DRAFT_310730 [Martensiomyces pterosporus]|nr:hypothetical protein GQ54DRAFT_310730 [Martensiomyces pterosporus]